MHRVTNVEPSQDAEVLCEGWLKKRGVLGFKDRYFVLNHNLLAFYTDQPEATRKMKGSLKISANARVVENTSRPLCFDVICRGWALCVQARDQTAYKLWMERIALAVERMKENEASANSSGSDDDGSQDGNLAEDGERYTEHQFLATKFMLPPRYKNPEAIGQGSYGVVVKAIDQEAKESSSESKSAAAADGDDTPSAAETSTTTSFSSTPPEASSDTAAVAPHRAGSNKVAIKRTKDFLKSRHDARRTLRELRLLRLLQHPNIVQLRDVYIPNAHTRFNDIYIVLGLMDTNLHRVIYSSQELSEDHRKCIMAQIICALRYLHSFNIVHRDLKPSNILINADCAVRVCDFGLARTIADDPSADEADDDNDDDDEAGAEVEDNDAPSSPNARRLSNSEDKDAENDAAVEQEDPPRRMKAGRDSPLMTEYVMTRWYRAPEVMLAAGCYTTAVDVWSLACIYAEMCRHKALFKGHDYVDQLTRIFRALGKPTTDEEIEFIKGSRPREFVRNLPFTAPMALRDLCRPRNIPWETAQHVPVDEDGIDLLSKMLVLNPNHRLSVTEAAEHPYLAQYAQEFEELARDDPYTAIGSDVTRAVAMDDLENLELTRTHLRNAAVKEVHLLHGGWIGRKCLPREMRSMESRDESAHFQASSSSSTTETAASAASGSRSTTTIAKEIQGADGVNNSDAPTDSSTRIKPIMEGKEDEEGEGSARIAGSTIGGDAKDDDKVSPPPTVTDSQPTAQQSETTDNCGGAKSSSGKAGITAETEPISVAEVKKFVTPEKEECEGSELAAAESK